jgi:hypothetical protein
LVIGRRAPTARAALITAGMHRVVARGYHYLQRDDVLARVELVSALRKQPLASEPAVE